MKMSGARKVACALVALCCASQLSTAAQEITKDLSHGAQLKFKIAASLPEFTFEVVPEVNPADTYGNAQSTVKRIDVFRGNSEKPFQQLEAAT